MPDLSTYTDEQLLSLLNEGNEPAFSEIYERYFKKLYVSADKILQNRAAAEDVIQEVFISVWNRRFSLQIESLQSYLFQAVRFQVFKAIRSQKTGDEFFKNLLAATNQLVDEDPVVFKEFQTLLEKIIDALPDDQKAIFRMNRDQGLTYKQIAAEKNISVKTVEKKISQALRSIRLKLGDALLLVVLTHFSK